MPEIDAVLLGHELNLLGLVVLQVVLAVATAGFGYAAGLRQPRWVRIGYLLALLLAVGACALTLFACYRADDSTRGRLEGRIPGQYLSEEKAQNHLALIRQHAVWGVGIAVASVTAGEVLRRVGRRQTGR